MQWFRKVFFVLFLFYNSLCIGQEKVQTLTKLRWLEGRWEEEGELGKGPNFCGRFSPSCEVFLFPLLPRARAVAIYVAVGGGVDIG